MTTINYQEIEGWTDEELGNELYASKMKLSKLKFNHTITPLENTNVIKETRKHIARISTEISKRKLSK